MSQPDLSLYLDFAATSPIYPEVINCMQDILQNHYANPSSKHEPGFVSEQIIKGSRSSLSLILKIKSTDLFFTSSATESNNWAIESAWKTVKRKGGTLVAAIDSHPSIKEKMLSMQEYGANIFFVPVDKNGIIALNFITEKLPSDTKFFSILHVNNETGVIQPLDKIIPIIKSKFPEILIHLDTVQSFAKLTLSQIVDRADFISISSHKIGGPKGVGALIAKNSSNLSPLIHGGGQENLKRGGTENIYAIAGFSRAASIMHDNLDKNYKQVQLQQQLFETIILNSLTEIQINGAKSNRSPYISSISLKHIRGEVLLHALSEHNIFISTGSACSSKKDVFSPVLKAMGISKDFLAGSVRISYFPTLKEDQIKRAAEIFIETVKKLRSDIRG